MRPTATDVHVAWSVCLSVFLYLRVLITRVSCAKQLNRSRCRFGSWLMWSKEPCIRWVSRLDECICSGEGWPVSDAAFCQITLDIGSGSYRPFCPHDTHKMASLNNGKWTSVPAPYLYQIGTPTFVNAAFFKSVSTV